MSATEVELLARAHAMFRGTPLDAGLPGPTEAVPVRGTDSAAGDAAAAYRSATLAREDDLVRSLRVDAEVTRILAFAQRGHRQAARDTAAVLAAARTDDPRIDNPLAMHELMRRRLARLRMQRRHVATAHRRSRHARRAVRSLRYPLEQRSGPADQATRRAVRAALSRIGCPYVWGAIGPDRFDCSGLVAWAYAQSGISLPRTTYDQINVGMPVSRADVRPGDLVFPHTGHVQMAIGHNLVVEAPQPGANVTVSPLGAYIAIRRP